MSMDMAAFMMIMHNYMHAGRVRTPCDGDAYDT